jgi:cytochrome c oxidase assembly protein subunit 15
MRHDNRIVGWWLLACCALLVIMVLLGGLTRLTHSGLSIVEWQPVVGIVPPLNESDWQGLFAQYRQTPEFVSVNAGMSLAQFKGIFWLEFIHRAWGRLLGLAFAVPLVVFALTGRIHRRLLPRLGLLLLLGAGQGLVGWLMVKSGLVDDPMVSPVRLAAHLFLALLIYAGMLWTALDILEGPVPRRHSRAPRRHSRAPRRHSRAPRRHSREGGNPCIDTANFADEALSRPTMDPRFRGGDEKGWSRVPCFAVLTMLVLATMVMGALVAGLRAGLVDNTWPLMEGAVIPSGLFPQGWRSLIDDVRTVQFVHRCLAELTVLTALGLWITAPRRQPVVHWVAVIAVIQGGLGVATLVMVVPVGLASAHQMGALVLLSLCLWGERA